MFKQTIRPSHTLILQYESLKQSHVYLLDASTIYSSFCEFLPFGRTDLKFDFVYSRAALGGWPTLHFAPSVTCRDKRYSFKRCACHQPSQTSLLWQWYKTVQRCTISNIPLSPYDQNGTEIVNGEVIQSYVFWWHIGVQDISQVHDHLHFNIKVFTDLVST